MAAIDEITVLLELRGVAYVQTLASGGEKNTIDTLDAFREIGAVIEKMSIAGLALLKALGLSQLGETSWWNVVLQPSKSAKDLERRDALLFEFVINSGVAGNVLPALRLLISNDEIAASSSPGLVPTLFTVTLYDEHVRPEAPSRVVDAIRSVNDVYDVLARLTDDTLPPLRLVAADSGSDKTFTFQGPEKIIAEVKDFFLQIFDRLAFYRQRKLSYDITVADQALNVLEKLNAAEEQGRIAAEEAEILRRKVLGARARAVETGLATTDMEVRGTNLRLLLGPSRPQLAAPTDDPPPEDAKPPA